MELLILIVNKISPFQKKKKNSSLKIYIPFTPDQRANVTGKVQGVVGLITNTEFFL